MEAILNTFVLITTVTKKLTRNKVLIKLHIQHSNDM